MEIEPRVYIHSQMLLLPIDLGALGKLYIAIIPSSSICQEDLANSSCILYYFQRYRYESTALFGKPFECMAHCTLASHYLFHMIADSRRLYV